MAVTEEIITKYIADVSDFTAKFQEVENRLKTQEAAIASFGKKGKEAFDEAGKGAEGFGKTISKDVSDGIGGVERRIINLTERIIAAFAVERVLAFAEASIKSFAAAELAASKLSFAVTKVLGGTVSQVKELISQSEQLTKQSYFSPRQIQEAQSMQAAFGLTANQIQKLTPIILNLAATQGTDLATATDTALRAIEGQTRGLKTIGADFKDTGSAMGNYNKLLENLDKLNGAATNSLNTTAGAIKNQEKEIELLKESIGKELAGGWLIAQKAGLEYTSKIFDAIKFLNDPQGFLIKQNIELVKSENEKIIATTKAQFASKSLGELEIALQKARAGTLAGSKEELANTSIRIKAIEDLVNAKKHDVDVSAFANENISKQNKQQLNETILILQQRDVNAKEIKDEIERRKKQIEEIEKEEKKALDARIKAQEEASKKLAELRIASEEKAAAAQVETDPIKKLDAEYDAALKNAVRTFDLTSKSAKDRENLAATLAAIEIEFENKMSDETVKIKKETLKKLAEENKKRDELNKQNAKDDLAATLSSVVLSIQNQKTALTKQFKDKGDFSKAAQAKLNDELEIIELQGDLAKNKEILRLGDDFDKEKLAAAKKVAEDEQKLNEKGVKDFKAAEEQKKRIIEEALSDAEKITNQIFDLQKALNDSKIQELTDQQTAIDEQFQNEQNALDTSHNKKKISERAYQEQSANIKQQQIEADKKIAKEIAEIKRKQAIADKEKAIFDIILNTARSIEATVGETGFFGTPLAIIMGTLGALQLATVIAQPIPKFAKGKRSGEQAGLSMVGEQGAELMFVPDSAKILPANKVRTYGEAIDAMYGGKWDNYINEKYITPALIAYKAKADKSREKSFADNIVQSMMFNNFDEHDMRRALGAGININNVDQLGKSIAKHLQANSSPYH